MKFVKLDLTIPMIYRCVEDARRDDETPSDMWRRVFSEKFGGEYTDDQLIKIHDSYEACILMANSIANEDKSVMTWIEELEEKLHLSLLNRIQFFANYNLDYISIECAGANKAVMTASPKAYSSYLALLCSMDQKNSEQ